MQIRCLFQRNCTQCNDGSSTLNSYCSWWSRIVEITSIKFEWRKRENYQCVHLQIVACPNIFWYIPFAFRVISFARFFLHLQRSNVGTTFPPLARFGSNSWLPWLSLAFLLVSLFFTPVHFNRFRLHTHILHLYLCSSRVLLITCTLISLSVSLCTRTGTLSPYCDTQVSLDGYFFYLQYSTCHFSLYLFSVDSARGVHFMHLATAFHDSRFQKEERSKKV